MSVGRRHRQKSALRYLFFGVQSVIRSVRNRLGKRLALCDVHGNDTSCGYEKSPPNEKRRAQQKPHPSQFNSVQLGQNFLYP